MKPARGRSRGRRGPLFTLAVAGGMGMQLPAVAAAGYLSGHYLGALVGAALLTTPMLAAARRGFGAWHRSRLQLYLGLWPFFTWWAICLAFSVAGPIGLTVAALTSVPVRTALAWSGVAAVIAGMRAIYRGPRVDRHDIAIADLPPAFDGYRIAQISDLHCGPFASGRRVRRWVGAVNKLQADLVAVTGDLIASGAAYVPTVARELGGLLARDGAFACMGNHDYFTDGDALARALETNGLTVLRNRGVAVTRGPARIFLAGVDDTWTGRADLARTLAGRPAETPAILLAHDPSLFTGAAQRGVELTLSGHTHGGQIAFPLAPRRWNLAKLITPFTTGLYRRGDATLYVNRGLGFTGPPVRFGAAPEIALLTLRRSPRPATAARAA